MEPMCRLVQVINTPPRQKSITMGKMITKDFSKEVDKGLGIAEMEAMSIGDIFYTEPKVPMHAYHLKWHVE